MQWAWKGYRTYAWGEDELLPLSHASHRWFGLGLTLVDSLDTLHMMGLEEELAEARVWVARNLVLDQVCPDDRVLTDVKCDGTLSIAFMMSTCGCCFEMLVRRHSQFLSMLCGRLLGCRQSNSACELSKSLFNRTGHDIEPV